MSWPLARLLAGLAANLNRERKTQRGALSDYAGKGRKNNAAQGLKEACDTQLHQQDF
jgi:hypothetical protein